MKTWMQSVLSRTAASSVLLATGASALAGSAAPDPLYLVCSVSDAPICQALSQELVRRDKARPVVVLSDDDPVPETAPVIVRFIQDRRRTDMLSGHLSWYGPRIDPGTGPTLELSVMDGFLTDHMIAGFAQQLLKSSNLPL